MMIIYLRRFQLEMVLIFKIMNFKGAFGEVKKAIHKLTG